MLCVHAEALHTVRHTPQRRQLDIVVSHFDEDLEGVSSYIDTLRQLPNIASRHSTVWLYTKGSDSQEALANISAWVKPDHIFHLLNIGREGHTYLTHITETYHDLAEFTIFIQASVHSLELTLSRLRGMFTQHTGVLALGDVWTCSCDGCYLPQERLASQRDIYSLFSNTFCPGEVTVFAHGMFLVSSRRVQQHSLDKYMLIKSMFEAPSGHFIHKGAVDLSSPDFGAPSALILVPLVPSSGCKFAHLAGCALCTSCTLCTC